MSGAVEIPVYLDTSDAAIVRAALDRIQRRYAVHDPSDDGQIGKTPTLGWERRGRGLVGEVALRRWLGQPVTVELLSDSYGAGDVVLPSGLVLESRAVRRSHYRLPHYGKDAPGRYWVKVVVTEEALLDIQNGRTAKVYIHRWASPEVADDPQTRVWDSMNRCFFIHEELLRDPRHLSEIVERENECDGN